MRRTHLIPEDAAGLRRLGRSLGLRRDPVAELQVELREQRLEVRRLHEKIFYRPLLDYGRAEPAHSGLGRDAARQRLAALGFMDPSSALRHLEAMTTGVRRSAKIRRTLLPVMLEWFADTPDPDAGLFGFRRISEALGQTPWYLRMLRDEGEVAQRMALILGTPLRRHAAGP